MLSKTTLTLPTAQNVGGCKFNNRIYSYTVDKIAHLEYDMVANHLSCKYIPHVANKQATHQRYPQRHFRNAPWNCQTDIFHFWKKICMTAIRDNHLGEQQKLLMTPKVKHLPLEQGMLLCRQMRDTKCFSLQQRPEYSRSYKADHQVVNTSRSGNSLPSEDADFHPIWNWLL